VIRLAFDISLHASCRLRPQSFHHARIKGPCEACQELMTTPKILPIERAIDVAAVLKRQGLRLVFTNGCFDVLHLGHTRILAEARKLGDRLLVAVNSDRSVRALKGPGRPIFPENERTEILAALAAVDYVTVFDDLTPRDLISRIQPHVLVKGADWAPDQIVGKEEVESAGGQVLSIPVVQGFSTSWLIQAALKTGC
jgi:D-glycero-beta-D-manno-heptose 1-phosphate adenylyltransferase